ncbi:MAG TPA: RidA family protein [Gemmatimonadaceae bacterium]
MPARDATIPESALPTPVAVPGWPQPRGYSDVVHATGRVVALAGQVGWNPVTREFDTDDFAAQCGQCLRNITTALRAAGAEPKHLVRLTWYITRRDAYLASRERLGELYREIVGRHFPAMSVVLVSGLLEPRALVEIEATAVVP